VSADRGDRPGVRGGPPWHVIVVSTFAVPLIGQGALSFLVEPEPYPTVRMPNFGRAPTPEGRMRVTSARMEAVGADGTTRTVDASALMSTFRFSAARPSYDHLLRNAEPSTLSGPAKAWLRARIETLNQGVRPIEVRMCWQQSEVSVVDGSTVHQQPCTWRTLPL
jgi:hypothetical protein